MIHGFFYNIDDGGTAALFAVIGGLILLIGSGINFLIVYPKIRMIKKIDADIRNLKTDSEATAGKIRDLEAEAEKISYDIRKAVCDFVKKDRLITADSAKEQASEFGKIKQHQCPSCGGSLRIDRDKQMYHCTFCGSTYDYEYFREERIHEAGETYLSRGEFMATSDAYEFMLKKDPHDFIALRGLMLAAAHLTDMNELDQNNTEFDYDSKIVSQVIENASEEDKKYFTEFAKVYAEKKRLVDCSEELENLLEEKKKINSVITQNNISGRGELRSRGDLMTGFIALWVGFAFFMLMTIVFIKLLIYGWAIFFGIISLALVVSNIYGYCSGLKEFKESEKVNAELYAEVSKIDDKIRELEKESTKLTGDTRRFIHDFVRKDRLIMRENKSTGY